MKRDLGILRERTFRHIFLARGVSLLGTSMAPVALAFGVLGQPGGSAARLLLVGPVAAAVGIERTLIAAGALVALGNVAALSARSVRRLPSGVRAEAGTSATARSG
jgi:hypothetical protein